MRGKTNSGRIFFKYFNLFFGRRVLLERTQKGLAAIGSRKEIVTNLTERRMSQEMVRLIPVEVIEGAVVVFAGEDVVGDVGEERTVARKMKKPVDLVEATVGLQMDWVEVEEEVLAVAEEAVGVECSPTVHGVGMK